MQAKLFSQEKCFSESKQNHNNLIKEMHSKLFS